MHQEKFKPVLLSVLVGLCMHHTAHADEDKTTHLGTLTITADKAAANNTFINQTTLNNENIKDSKDLVRYNLEVDVADVGRYGNKGFAMRGVDGNRIAMNIDGVALPETEANEIFSPYGYMYEGRFNPDLEMMGGVSINAGADSLSVGSGAVGGSVSYFTKEPNSLVKEGNLGGYLKTGYSSKSEEWQVAAGVAAVQEKTEFLINASRSMGHELKNHAMRDADNNRLNPSYIFSEEEVPVSFSTTSLIYPNPLRYTKDSALTKFYYRPNDSHRFGVQGLWQKKESLINTDSANLTTGSRTGSTTRRAFDTESFKSYGINYRYQPVTDGLLDELSLSHTKSEIEGVADTWIYNRAYQCAVSGLSSSRCPMDSLSVSDVTLFNREYRPTTTTADQSGLKLKIRPLTLGRFGTHAFSFNANHTKQDYSTSAMYLSNSAFIESHLSYALPDAKKTNQNFSLTDHIDFNDRLKAMLGVRYDRYHYKPYFQDNVQGFDEYARSISPCNNFTNNTLYCQNHRNGESLKDTRFSHTTYAASLDYAIIPEKLTARYKVGTGFLAPTVTQIYSQFEGLGVRQVPNYNLRPETSISHDLEFNFKPTQNLTLSASGYLTQYDDFIHTRFWQGNTNHCTERLTCLQSTNLDEATVRGLKLGMDANLSSLFKLNGDLAFTAQYHTSKDKAQVKTDNDGTLNINTLAATPDSLLLGLDYISPKKDWTLHGRVRGIFRKKAEDTKTLSAEAITETKVTVCPADIAFYGYCSWYGYTTPNANGEFTKVDSVITGYKDYVDTYTHIDKSENAVILDIYGTKRFGKDRNILLNAGVYNLTDVNYIPWEALRQFNNVNANSLIDSSGHGFNRYTAPGRNYAVSLTYEF